MTTVITFKIIGRISRIEILALVSFVVVYVTVHVYIFRETSPRVLVLEANTERPTSFLYA